SLEQCHALLADVANLVEGEAKAALRRKRARQAARRVLPNAAEALIVVTGNARARRRLIELRASPAAEAETRRASREVLQVLQQEAPHIFGDYRIENGVAVTEYRSV